MSMKPIRIALTKGRLEKDTVALFQKLGFDCEQLLNKGRKLILEVPDANLDVGLLERDTELFFAKVDTYRQELDTLIGGQTAELAFAIADEVIRGRLTMIHVLSEDQDSVVPTALYISRIKNFFLTSIDWWLEQENCMPREAARIYCKMMRLSAVNMFRYQQMQNASEQENR